ncbi:MAG: DUF1579 family protein [Armatimonas sp.]
MNESMVGSHTGVNLLNLSWLPEPEFVSEGTMRVENVAGGNFWQLSYTWSHEGTAHSGVMLLGISPESGEASAAWGDSWHQNGSLLILRGAKDTDTGGVSVQGSYPAESGPDWGWRIAITQPAPDTIEMVMTNIMPDGPEEWAVRATYQRTA